MSNLTGVKVLVIDDSNTIRRSAEIFLGQAGCEVVLAEDGFDALAKIVDHRPDIIFVDIMMPKLNGYEVCQHVKEDPAITGIGIVLLTAKGQEVDRRQGLEPLAPPLVI